MLLKRDDSQLLIVDVQQKLMPHIHEHQKVLDNCQWLMRLAHELEIPISVSEQYPKGLGETLPELKGLVSEKDIHEKVHFSLVSDKNCKEQILKAKKDQIVIAGIEAHVCVLQSAMELLNLDKKVFIVADAVGSRKENDLNWGLKRLSECGATIVTKEMVFFEWLHQAGTERFKRLSKQFLK
jgi:nicotinamidase-related amidase